MCNNEAGQIAHFLSSFCREGVQIVSEMERSLFANDFFLHKTMRREIPTENDINGSFDATPAVENSDIASILSRNNTTDASDVATLDQLNPDSSQFDGGTIPNQIEQTIEKRTLSLLKIEKTMLDCLSAKDFDGNYVLDSLLYLTMVPLSDDKFMVRSVIEIVLVVQRCMKLQIF